MQAKTQADSSQGPKQSQIKAQREQAGSGYRYKPVKIAKPVKKGDYIGDNKHRGWFYFRIADKDKGN